MQHSLSIILTTTNTSKVSYELAIYTLKTAGRTYATKLLTTRREEKFGIYIGDKQKKITSKNRRRYSFTNANISNLIPTTKHDLKEANRALFMLFLIKIIILF